MSSLATALLPHLFKNGNFKIAKKCGPLTQLIFCKSLADKTRAGVSWIILGFDVDPLVNAGIFQDFANRVCNKDWWRFIRVTPLKNGHALSPFEDVVNITVRA